MNGTEKQITWANGIKTSIINKIDALIEAKNAQIKTKIPARYDTQEKIDALLAKRAVKNGSINAAITALETKKQKLNAVTEAHFIIDNRDNLSKIDCDVEWLDFYRFVNLDGTTDPRV